MSSSVLINKKIEEFINYLNIMNRPLDTFNPNLNGVFLKKEKY